MSKCRRRKLQPRKGQVDQGRTLLLLLLREHQRREEGHGRSLLLLPLQCLRLQLRRRREVDRPKLPQLQLHLLPSRRKEDGLRRQLRRAMVPLKRTMKPQRGCLRRARRDKGREGPYAMRTTTVIRIRISHLRQVVKGERDLLQNRLQTQDQGRDLDRILRNRPSW